MERSRADARQRINAMLNAEQQKRYAEIVAAETGRAGAVGGSGRVFVLAGGAPQEVRIRTGLTDGNTTEVVSGELARGPGGDRGHAAALGRRLRRPAGNAPRLPF